MHWLRVLNSFHGNFLVTTIQGIPCFVQVQLKSFIFEFLIISCHSHPRLPHSLVNLNPY